MRRQLVRAFSTLKDKLALTECELKKTRLFSEEYSKSKNKIKRGEVLANILLAQGNKIVIIY